MIEIKHIRLIKEIVEKGSLSKASTSLNLTISALSHQLSDLEDILQLDLFDRYNRNKLVATKEGLMFYHYANQIEEILNDLLDTISPTNQSVNQITMGIEKYTSFGWFLDLKKRIDENLFSININSGTNNTKSLHEGDIDILVSSYYENQYKLKSTFLFNEELKLFAPKGYFKKSFVSLAEIDKKEKTLLTHCDEKDFSQILEGSLNYCFKSVNIKSYSNTELILELINQGYGCSILSPWLVSCYLDGLENIQEYTVTENLLKKWFLVYDENKLKKHFPISNLAHLKSILISNYSKSSFKNNSNIVARESKYL